MERISKNKIFQIHIHTKDDDSYFYSNTSYQYSVISIQTGDELFSFSGSSNSNHSGTSESGISDIFFDNDANFLIIKHYDSKKEKIELPTDIKIENDNNHIILEYLDGHTEKRKRNIGIFTTKYGQPYEITPLKMSKK